MRLSVIFSLLVSILPVVSSAAGAPLCRGVFNESATVLTNGLIDQENPEFKKFGLLPEGEPSQLCGITSLANFMNIQLAKKCTPMAATPLVDFIAEKSREFMISERRNGNRHFSIIGMYSFDLARMAEPILQSQGLHYKINSRSELLADQKITENDMLNLDAAIWSVQFTPSDGSNGGSHFILVLSYEHASKKISFIDPLEPKKIKTAHLSFPAESSSESVKVQLDPGSDMEKLTGKISGTFDITGLVGFRHE